MLKLQKKQYHDKFWPSNTKINPERANFDLQTPKLTLKKLILTKKLTFFEVKKKIALNIMH